ncbi:sensor domain-containing diguanylate cyclase [Clostridium polynesiense]|uniref:sensor domain-containing diguanylate cyclase n=1 Tax=Clostridium polynesiense TaxID=1325933 RepID=UPI00058AF3FF|nr:diguanylate cyclase [Clostridium polynesiense]
MLTFILVIGFVLGILAANVLSRYGISILKLQYCRCKNRQNTYKMMLDSGKDIMYYYEVFPEKRFVYLSPAVQTVLGWKAGKNLSNPYNILNLVHPEDQDLLIQKARGELDYSKPIFMRFRHKDGEYIWTEDYAVPIYKNNKLIAITGSIRDITLRKKLEELIEYKSNYDTMTGIYNRQYFEWVFERLDKHKNTRTAILICEIRGMKHRNERLGLNGGNDFIKSTAELLKKFMDESSMFFRISGDEFAYILVDVEEKAVIEKVRSIEEEVKKINSAENQLPIEMTVGYGYTLSSFGRMNYALKVATDMINKNKEKLNILN